VLSLRISDRTFKGEMQKVKQRIHFHTMGKKDKRVNPTRIEMEKGEKEEIPLPLSSLPYFRSLQPMLPIGKTQPSQITGEFS
jgi:hypothetical protein